jgi:hypothetical protein
MQFERVIGGAGGDAVLVLCLPFTRRGSFLASVFLGRRVVGQYKPTISDVVAARMRKAAPMSSPGCVDSIEPCHRTGRACCTSTHCR